MNWKRLIPILIGIFLCHPLGHAATNTVVIGEYFFNPTNLSINIGDTVRWTNSAKASTTHDVSRTNLPFPWLSGDLNFSKPTFLLTFSNAGSFPYYCARHVYPTLPANLHAEQTGAVTVVSGNLPPAIALTNPPTNAKLRAPTSILLQATASDDGIVTNVAFFSGLTLLGSTTVAPFNFTVSNAPAGNYSFSARASDNTGLTSTSTSVSVFVLTNAHLTAPAALPNGQFRFTVTGIAGQTYTAETSSNLSAWSAFATNIAPTDTFHVTNSGATNVLNRFYRMRQDF